MALSILLYRIEKESIVPIESGSENDILLVEMRDEGKLFVYRGRYSETADEFVSRKLYERIINKFHNSNIMVLKSKLPIANDPKDVLAVKNFLLDHMEDDKKFERNRFLKRLFLLEGIREDIRKFKNYENSREWRASVSNLTQLRKLSVFNFWSLIAIALILIVKTALDISSGKLIFINSQSNVVINPELFRLWIQNLSFTLLLCAVILIIVAFVNFLFVSFPMRFPIKPYEYSILQALNIPKTDTIQDVSTAKSVTSVEAKPLSEVLAPPVPERKGGKAISPQVASIKMVIDRSKKQKDSMPEEYKLLKEDKEEKLGMKDEKLSIPEAPLPKDQKKKLNVPVLDKKIFRDIKVNTDTHQVVIIECDRCGGPISMPVPKKLILESDVPVVEFVYVHGNPPHCLIAQLDKNFNERRRRTTDLIDEKEYK